MVLFVLHFTREKPAPFKLCWTSPIPATPKEEENPLSFAHGGEIGTVRKQIRLGKGQKLETGGHFNYAQRRNGLLIFKESRQPSPYKVRQIAISFSTPPSPPPKSLILICNTVPFSPLGRTREKNLHLPTGCAGV